LRFPWQNHYEIVSIAEGDGFENDRHCERWAIDCDGYMELADFIQEYTLKEN